MQSIFKYSLGIGNYLNGKSMKGGAYGFKISSLEKFLNIKSNDNKYNLLMYVIEKVETDNEVKDKAIINVNEDHSNLNEASKLPVDQLSTDLNDLKN